MRIRITSNAHGYVYKLQRAIVAAVITTLIGACAAGTSEETGNGDIMGTAPDIGAAVEETVDTNIDQIITGNGPDVVVTPDTNFTGIDSGVDIPEGGQIDIDGDVDAITDTVEIPGVDEEGAPEVVATSEPSGAELKLDLVRGAIELSWNAVEDARSYRILERSKLQNGFVEIETIDDPETTTLSIPSSVHFRKDSEFAIETCSDDGCGNTAMVSMPDGNLIEGVTTLYGIGSRSTDVESSIVISDDGQWMAISNPSDGKAGTGVYSSEPELGYNNLPIASRGVVRVYQRREAQWKLSAYIKPSDLQAIENFGANLMMSSDGSRLVVLPSSGRIYTYARDENGWYLESEEYMVDGPRNFAMNDDGNVLVATIVNKKYSYSDYVSIYRWDLTGWKSVEAFGQVYYEKGSLLGAPVRVNRRGTTVLTWGYKEDYRNLAVIRKNGTTWAHSEPFQDELTGGFDMSSDGTRVVFGTGLVEEGGINTKAILVYTLDGDNWRLEASLPAPSVADSDDFGSTVVLSNSGTTLAVSSIDDDSSSFGMRGDPTDSSSPNSGAVHLYQLEAGQWVYSAYVKPIVRYFERETPGTSQIEWIMTTEGNPGNYTDVNSTFGKTIALDELGETLSVVHDLSGNKTNVVVY